MATRPTSHFSNSDTPSNTHQSSPAPSPPPTASSTQNNLNTSSEQSAPSPSHTSVDGSNTKKQVSRTSPSGPRHPLRRSKISSQQPNPQQQPSQQPGQPQQQEGPTVESPTRFSALRASRNTVPPSTDVAASNEEGKTFEFGQKTVFDGQTIFFPPSSPSSLKKRAEPVSSSSSTASASSPQYTFKKISLHSPIPGVAPKKHVQNPLPSNDQPDPAKQNHASNHLFFPQKPTIGSADQGASPNTTPPNTMSPKMVTRNERDLAAQSDGPFALSFTQRANASLSDKQKRASKRPSPKNASSKNTSPQSDASSSDSATDASAPSVSKNQWGTLHFSLFDASASQAAQEDYAQQDQAFETGLQTVFQIVGDTAAPATSASLNDFPVLEVSDDEAFQQEEERARQENLDALIRQNDADSLFQLGKKYEHLTQFNENSSKVDVNPQSILEAMLFVGDRENRPLILKRATELMRNVSELEAIEALHDLNERYYRDQTPYHIVRDNNGFRLVLKEEYEPIRERFQGKNREFKLSQRAIDVLALIAYKQPVSYAEIQDLQGNSASILTLLTKRNLIVQEKKTVEHKTVSYFRTTDRFLKLFNLNSLNDLPVVDEINYR